MSEKKMIGRTVAIALGIICIILIAGLGGAMAYYTMIINDKNTTYDSYVSNHTYTNSEYDNYVGNHTHTNSEYDVLQSNYNYYVSTHSHTDSEYDSLQNQVNDLNSIINLEKSTVWVDDQTISQPASSFTVWTFSANYAGYVSVWVQSSTVPGTHVKVIYSAYGVSFNQKIVVSAGDTAVFPILPSSSIQVGVGNGNLISGATETVTITYHY